MFFKFKIYIAGYDCYETFEIHGEIGVISHAIVHCQNFTPDGLSGDAYRRIEYVLQLLHGEMLYKTKLHRHFMF